MSSAFPWRMRWSHAVALLRGILATTLIGFSSSACGDRDTPVTPLTGVPLRLEFTVQPTSNKAGNVLAPPIEVVLLDGVGQVVTNATDPIALSIQENPAGGRLFGTDSVRAVDGVATFSDVWIDKAGTGYTLLASSDGMEGAVSEPFAIEHAEPAGLGFRAQPTDAEGNEPISPAVTVAIEDAFGNPIPDATATVSVAIGENPGESTLFGTTVAETEAGIAVFPDLRVSNPGAGYTLEASSEDLSGVASQPFDVHLTFASVSTAMWSTCGASVAGHAYCWGDGRTLTPALVPGGLRFRSVSAGLFFACGITMDGEAYCWGSGPLGDGTSVLRSSSDPVAVAGGLQFAMVNSGSGHACGVTSGGEAYCWGYNSDGELGDGTTVGAAGPVLVSTRISFSSISAGDNQTCALATDGRLYCWGANSYGEFGNGSQSDGSLTPVPAAGSLILAWLGDMRDDTVCGVSPAGLGYCWGRNSMGQIGGNIYYPWAYSPVRVAGMLAFESINAGIVHSCGVTLGGDAYCWGRSDAGQLGDGTIEPTRKRSPQLVVGGLRFASVSANGLHTCGVTVSGDAYCWGDNRFGQLGDGTKERRTEPTRVVQ